MGAKIDTIAPAIGNLARAVPNEAGSGRSTKEKLTSGNNVKKDTASHYARYDVISSLGNTSSGIGFRQLLCGDAEEPQKEFNRLYSDRN